MSSASTEASASVETDERAAGAQLSTAPVEESGQAVPGSFGGVRAPGPLGAVGWLGREIFGWLRWMWRQLTSMRLALILLFLLSIAAIPGSLVPQTSVDETKVADFKTAHETLAPLYDKLGLFHVYSSPWFSAIYLLLFISLAGCIVPRSWQFVGQLRSRPPGAPRKLTRMPAYATWRTDAEPEAVLEAARKQLRGNRFRTNVAGTAVAAEKGYLREAGNLLFHVALFGILISFATGTLWKAEGGKLVLEGGGFSNSLTQYDDFKSGTFYDTDDLDAFGFTLDSFDATYAESGPQKGTARTFRANIHYWTSADGTEWKSSIEVNKPLEVGDSKVYLIGHGYAPVVTVRDARGEISYRGPTPFLPVDSNVTSTGVVKVTDNYRNAKGEKEQLGISGLFTPTLSIDPVKGAYSSFPALDFPALLLTAYHGDLGVDSGLPQSVYQLDTDHMTQFKDEDDNPFSEVLKPGEKLALPDGAGSVTFDRIDEWATFQVSHQPGNGLALGSAVAALLGLAGSLFIQRRRVWVRAERGTDGVTVVELAGLGRSESARIADELGDIVGALLPAAPIRPDAPDAPDTGDAYPSDAPADPADPVPSDPESQQDEDEGARA